MYLFVFLWVPSMQSAFPPSSPQSPLPLGIIFSCFMFSMMIGSLIYTTVASHSNPRTTDASPVLHAKLSSLVCLAGGIALAVSVKADQAHTRFWSFCAFEACVGMYYPVQGMLRGSMIADDHRATVRCFLCSNSYMLILGFFQALLAFPCSTQHLCHLHTSFGCRIRSINSSCRLHCCPHGRECHNGFGHRETRHQSHQYSDFISIILRIPQKQCCQFFPMKFFRQEWLDEAK